VLVLLGRGAPLWLLALTAFTGQALIFSTGLFRVLAGRHFVTDVIVGMLAGALVAFAVAYLHRPRASR
jgi:membrane-associated phospholipid phosphatase